MSASDWNHETLDAISEALFSQGHRTALIQGGPGSGKTWTTAYLSSEAASRFSSPYQQALVLTFSVNAVNQITGQLHDYRQALASRPAGHVRVTNYHSFYRSLLDAYGRYLGIAPNWRTWLPHEVEHVLAGVNSETELAFGSGGSGRGERARRRWEASNALSIVDGLMDNLEPDATLATVAEVLRRHHQQGLLHYDSWPYFAYQILSNCHRVREHLGARYPIILIDEFQDTNGVEWEFIRSLAGGSVLVCMTDPAQAIYQWRGANPDDRLKRLRTERNPERPEGFELTANPRAAQQPSLRRFAVALKTACDGGPSLHVDTAPLGGVDILGVREVEGEAAGRAEGEWPKAYASQIRRLVRQNWRESKRMAILCPTWPLLSAIKWSLGSGEHPLKPDVLGLEEEVGCFLGAWAHCLDGRILETPSGRPQAELALNKLRRCPQKDGTLNRWFSDDHASLHTENHRRVSAILEEVSVYCRRQGSLLDAVADLEKLAEMACREMSKVWVAESFLHKPLRGWIELLKDYLRRNESCSADELLHIAWSGIEGKVARERLRLARSRLVLMTIHASKGREFEHTIVCGASKNTRHLKPAKDLSDCASVRNLLMVACSRSRKRVTVLHKHNEPCCVLARLQGEPCPFADERRAGSRGLSRGHSPHQASMEFDTE